MHTYCVILRLQRALNGPYLRAKRYYLRANSATQATLIASEDPEWRVSVWSRHVCPLLRYKVNDRLPKRIGTSLRPPIRAEAASWCASSLAR